MEIFYQQLFSFITNYFQYALGFIKLICHGNRRQVCVMKSLILCWFTKEYVEFKYEIET